MPGEKSTGLRRGWSSAVWWINAGPAEKGIGGTPDPGQVPIRNVGVVLGGGGLLVPQEPLDVAQVGSLLQEMGGERVPQGVRGHPLSDSGIRSTDCHGALDGTNVHVTVPAVPGEQPMVRAFVAPIPSKLFQGHAASITTLSFLPFPSLTKIKPLSESMSSSLKRRAPSTRRPAE